MFSSGNVSGWVKSKMVFRCNGALATTSNYGIADDTKGRLSGKMRVSASCALSSSNKVMGMSFTLNGASLDRGQGRIADGVGTFPGKGQFQFHMIRR